jgi:Fic family protein
MRDYKWKPIQPLTDDDKHIDLTSIKPLYELWQQSQRSRELTTQPQLKDFNERLVRRLSIETGILEHLYDLDRGTTEALVAQGFLEDLVERSTTSIEPARLIDLLRDQESAIALVVDGVSRKRPLTKSFLNELHSTLTKHQDTTTALDQFGNRIEVPLLKGAVKIHPNNPKRPQGDVHEYCPPVHVVSEIDALLNMYANYSDEDPVVVAAWLHHRFTQIHPYQDGNGRLARALTTLVLLRADLLPLVIDRKLRSDYIASLEAADEGDLSKLVHLFAGLERTAILQALSVDVEADISRQKNITSAVLESLSAKFNQRRITKTAELRGVNQVALKIRSQAKTFLDEAVPNLRKTLSEIGKPSTVVIEGGSDKGTGYWYRFEVVRSAQDAGKFANFAEDHYFVKLKASVDDYQLDFVVSLHHVGREISGLMEATAFAKFEFLGDSSGSAAALEDFEVCSLEPFIFTYKTNADDVKKSFRRWVDSAFAIALKGYGNRL